MDDYAQSRFYVSRKVSLYSDPKGTYTLKLDGPLNIDKVKHSKREIRTV